MLEQCDSQLLDVQLPDHLLLLSQHDVFLQTYGSFCAIEPPLGGGEETQAFGGEESRFSLSPNTARALRENAGGLISGLLAWPIPAALDGPGPHDVAGLFSVDTETYEYSGEIRFMYGTAVIRYEINGHPDLRSLEAQFGPMGFGGTVLVYKTDGEVEKLEISGR